MHYYDHPKLADRYLSVDRDKRGAYLSSSVDPLLLSQIQGSTEPRDIDSLEWFASADDICRAFSGLSDRSKQLGLSPVASALSISNGGIGLNTSTWPTCGSWAEASPEYGRPVTRPRQPRSYICGDGSRLEPPQPDRWRMDVGAQRPDPFGVQPVGIVTDKRSHPRYKINRCRLSGSVCGESIPSDRRGHLQLVDHCLRAATRSCSGRSSISIGPRPTLVN